jgi:hypothetical protein
MNRISHLRGFIPDNAVAPVLNCNLPELKALESRIEQLGAHVSKWAEQLTKSAESRIPTSLRDEAAEFRAKGQKFLSSIAKSAKPVIALNDEGIAKQNLPKGNSASRLSNIGEQWRLLTDNLIKTQALSYQVLQDTIAKVTSLVSGLAKAQQQVYLLQRSAGSFSTFWANFKAQFPTDKQADIPTNWTLKNLCDPAWINARGNTPSDDPKGVLSQEIKKFWKSDHWEFPVVDGSAENLELLNSFVPAGSKPIECIGSSGSKKVKVDATTIPTILKAATAFIYANSGLPTGKEADQLPAVKILGDLADGIMAKPLSESGISAMQGYMNDALTELQALQSSYTSTLTGAKSANSQTNQFFQQDFAEALKFWDWN